MVERVNGVCQIHVHEYVDVKLLVAPVDFKERLEASEEAHGLLIG